VLLKDLVPLLYGQGIFQPAYARPATTLVVVSTLGIGAPILALINQQALAIAGVVLLMVGAFPLFAPMRRTPSVFDCPIDFGPFLARLAHIGGMSLFPSWLKSIPFAVARSATPPALMELLFSAVNADCPLLWNGALVFFHVALFAKPMPAMPPFLLAPHTHYSLSHANSLDSSREYAISIQERRDTNG
jgi:hypothetical protein